MKEEKRIYVVIPALVEVPNATYLHNGRHFVNFQKGVQNVVQPPGRQIAQACHVVSKLRHETDGVGDPWNPLTTIILQARDSQELIHNFLAIRAKKLQPVIFSDENEAAYGKFQPVTALAVLAKPSQMKGVLDYLPLWGS